MKTKYVSYIYNLLSYFTKYVSYLSELQCYFLVLCKKTAGSHEKDTPNYATKIVPFIKPSLGVASFATSR